MTIISFFDNRQNYYYINDATILGFTNDFIYHIVIDVSYIIVDNQSHRAMKVSNLDYYILIKVIS